MNSPSREFLWTAPDGLRFPCERLDPTGPVRGVIVCVHGLGGAVMDFEPLFQRLSSEGFSVWGMNLRGQGHDPIPTRRGARLDLPRIADDLVTFAGEAALAHPGVPVFWCGESLGALLVTWMLANGFDAAAHGAVFSVPVVKLRKPTPWVVRQGLKALALFVPDGRFNPSWFVSGKDESLRVTRDAEHSARVRAAPHYVRAFSFKFLDQLGDLMDDSHQLAAKVTVPSLVLSAGQDVYLEPAQTREWFEELAANDKCLMEYPDSFHLLWNDWDRDIVLNDIAQWLGERAR